MEPSDVQRLRDVETDHAKLKRMYAELEGKQGKTGAE